MSITLPQDVEYFQAYMQGDARYNGTRPLSIHGGGHSTIGQDGNCPFFILNLSDH